MAEKSDKIWPDLTSFRFTFMIEENITHSWFPEGDWEVLSQYLPLNAKLRGVEKPRNVKNILPFYFKHLLCCCFVELKKPKNWTVPWIPLPDLGILTKPTFPTLLLREINTKTWTWKSLKSCCPLWNDTYNTELRFFSSIISISDQKKEKKESVPGSFPGFGSWPEKFSRLELPPRRFSRSCSSPE